MIRETKRIQPYLADDGDYVMLVDFILQAAPLLHQGFIPDSVWSDRETESIPYVSDVTRFNYGNTQAGIRIIHRKGYEPKAGGHVEDEVIATCYGLPEDSSLELRTHRYYHDPRFVEIQVAGQEKAVSGILERFSSHFNNEAKPDASEVTRLLRIARSAVRVHAWRAAEMNSIEALRGDPLNDEALMYLGIARAAQGFEPEGETHLLASLTLNPKNSDAYYNLGLLALKQGRSLFATDCFEHGLSIDPSNHALLFQYGRALERIGRLQDALQAHQQCVLQSPNPGQLWGFTGMDFTGEAKEAIERIEMAIREDSNQTQY
ncbi:MAG: hypothetical protein EAX95_04450 [Candidatus Thorarchaeota archaeon]|nr:hypothetical protein [Candidatus Thorarchaeota archaeon]